MMMSEQIADEIYGLHCDIGRLEVENAALRQQLADAAESMGRVEERCAGLRELARDMCDFYCVMPGEPHASREEIDFSVKVWGRMRELGIEVD